MKLKQLQSKYRTQEERLKVLSAKADEDLSAEEQSEFAALVESQEKLQAEIDAEKAATQNLASLRSRAQNATAWGADLAAMPSCNGGGATVGVGAAPDPKLAMAPRQGGGFRLPATAVFSRPKNFKDRGGLSANERAFGFGQWFLASLGHTGANAWCREHGFDLVRLDKHDNIVQLAHVENVNTAGGVLVPAQWEQDLIDLREEYGVARRLFRNRTMTSDVLNIPRRTGGLTAYFVTDNVAITESTKGWDNVGLTAKKIGVLAKLGSELNEDAIIDVADDLAGEIAYAFAQKEDDCAFNGDGTSTYGNITGVRTKLLNLSATRANIAGLQVGTGNAWSELVLADFNATKAKLPAYAARSPRTRWVVSQQFWAGVMEKLALAAGGITDAMIAAGMEPRFLGFPVEISQAMPTVEANDVICALLGDFALGAAFGDRRRTTIMTSEHYSFANDVTDIRGTERFDIVVHDIGNQSATAASRVAGPIVGLATAAS